MSIHYEEYDEIDRKIAITLSKDASLTNADIGKIVGLSSSATNERIRKLKRDGKIKNIIALIKSDLLNMNLGVFIFVLVDDRNYNKQFLENVSKHDNILECHHITGKYSYLLKGIW